MRKIFTFTVATLLTASAFGAGEVYRWKGPDGTWHYSDQPRVGAELVRGPQRPVADPAAPAQPANATPAATASVASNQDLPVSNEVAQEVRQAAENARAEQCKKAEEMYQRALAARRITKGNDAQGNPIFMNEAEMDAARLQTRANRDLACGTGS